MKITNDRTGIAVDAEAAIEDKLYPDAYTYSGELEKIKKMNELQREFIAKFSAILCNKGLLTAEELSNLLGYGYEVTND